MVFGHNEFDKLHNKIFSQVEKNVGRATKYAWVYAIFCLVFGITVWVGLVVFIYYLVTKI